jgi:hypothetical protein
MDINIENILNRLEKINDRILGFEVTSNEECFVYFNDCSPVVSYIISQIKDSGYKVQSITKDVEMNCWVAFITSYDEE